MPCYDDAKQKSTKSAPLPMLLFPCAIRVERKKKMTEREKELLEIIRTDENPKEALNDALCLLLSFFDVREEHPKIDPSRYRPTA